MLLTYVRIFLFLCLFSQFAGIVVAVKNENYSFWFLIMFVVNVLLLYATFFFEAYNYEKSFSGKAPLFPTTERIYINDFDLQLFYDAYGDEDVEAFAMSLLPKPIRDDFENQKQIYF